MLGPVVVSNLAFACLHRWVLAVMQGLGQQCGDFRALGFFLGLGFRVDMAMPLAFKLTLNNTQFTGITHDNKESQGK